MAAWWEWLFLRYRNAKIKNEHIEKTSKPLTEEQQHNILHIYNDTGEKRVFLTFSCLIQGNIKF